MMVRCALFLLLLCSSRLSSAAETEHESEPDVTLEEPGDCMFTEETLIDAINASTFGGLTEAVVNCFAYRNVNGSLENAIVSGMNETASGVRYVVECVNNVLLLTESPEPFTNLTAHCAQCQDNTADLCVPGQECASNCTACFGSTQNECLACEIARSENQCVSECPPPRTPNSENGNECECPGYFFGTNCTECDLVCDGEDGAYFLDPDSCVCVTECPAGMFIELLDYMATVPEEIIGSPNTEDESETTGGIAGHERRRRAWHKNFRRAEESTHAEAEFVPEPSMCVSSCTIGSYVATASTDLVCYACHHTFCLECDTTSGECLQCRDGTLLNSSALNDAEFCLGFYAYMEELNEELEHEEEEELALFEQEQRDLIIFVPIACGVAFIFFVSMAVFAHFRYPHHGEKKRHRKPPREETANISEFEKSLRPQNTTRYR